MQSIKIEDIIITEDRQRKDFRSVPAKKLETSIASKGLMHPIVLKNDCRTLVAGERRIKAIKNLHKKRTVFSYNGELIEPGKIPFSLLGDLTEDDLLEAELEENLIREDLTWQEQVPALDKLHKLRTRQNPGQTRTDTAKEIETTTGKPFSTSMRKIHDAEIIAPHLDDPKVAAAPNVREAFKIVANMIEREFKAALEAKLKEEVEHTLIVGDMKDAFREIPDGTIDMIIADPPYGVGADGFGDFAKMDHKYKDTQEEAIKLLKMIAENSFRVAKKKAHLYIFCDIDLFCILKKIVHEAGWSPWRTPIIWTKGGSGHVPNADLGPRRVYELILFASKSKRHIRQLYLDHIPVQVPKDKQHAAEKPVALYSHFMRVSCMPGDTVLDPCCGSGTVFPAATKHKLIATGIEKDPEYAAIAKSRLKEKWNKQ